MKRVLSAFLALIMAICGVSVVANAYNSANAVYYAELFAYSTSPPYFTFFGNNTDDLRDCTNFVSSCLWNGDFAEMNDTSNKQYGINNESSEWYSVRYNVYTWFFGQHLNEHYEWKTSTTWIRVYNEGSGKGLYQYLKKTKNCNSHTCWTMTDLVNYADVGDVIQCVWEGDTEPGHSILVTGKTSNDVLVAAHSNPHYNDSFRDFFFDSCDRFIVIDIQ